MGRGFLLVFSHGASRSLDRGTDLEFAPFLFLQSAALLVVAGMGGIFVGRFRLGDIRSHDDFTC